MTFDRRTNALMRTFLTLVQAAVERGDLTPETAADLAIQHGVPMPVVRDVLTRAQGMDAVGEWPDLCASVTLPRYEPDGWTSSL